MNEEAPISLLVVDEKRQQIESYVRGLTSRGVQVKSVYSVEDALVEFERDPFPYDVVVLDLGMPPGPLKDDDDPACFLTGLRLYRVFRLEQRHPEPVILLSNLLDRIPEGSLPEEPLVRALDKGETRPDDLWTAIVDSVQRRSAVMNSQ